MLKKIILWTLIILVVLTGCFALGLNYEINQYWGEHTQKVSPDRFKQKQQKIVISNVSMLSEGGETMIPNQNVFIDSGVIVAIGTDFDIPEDAKIIDGKDQFLIPGLVDAHVHLWQSPNDLLLYLANGVTHIRELNGSEEHLQWKQEVLTGRAGPDIFVASRRHNSNNVIAGLFNRWTAKMNNVSSSESIEQDLLALDKQGFDAVKVYTHLTPEHFAEFNRVASQHNIKLLGHIPYSMKLEDIAKSNLRDLAHIEEIVKALDWEFGGMTRDNTQEHLDYVQERSDAVAKELAENNVSVVTTLTLSESFAKQKIALHQSLSEVELAYVNPGIAESTFPSIRVMGWLPDVNIYRLPENYPQDKIAGNQRYWKAYAQAHRLVLQALVKHQVTILAGTDANVPVMVPGFSLHEEFESMLKTGMSQADIIRTATENPATIMGIKSGKIKQGYQADLVLLTANPLQDIRNTRNIEAVISNGRLYERSTLDAMLDAVKQANDQSRTKSIAHLH
ncbi:amidohydrolase family protein [Glaciecola sp. 1036]|uniref:amidohydrolase family protein n=1 Tax=Alteromonadaceae TaxID=72275 RepID=UPI003CFF1B35